MSSSVHQCVDIQERRLQSTMNIAICHQNNNWNWCWVISFNFRDFDMSNYVINKDQPRPVYNLIAVSVSSMAYLISRFRNSTENGYKLCVQWFLGLFERFFSFYFAEEKAKPFVLCTSWLKGKFPACVMTIRLIFVAVWCCESSAKACPLMTLLLLSKNVKDGFQISVAHSFVCGWLKSRRFFSQCAIHSSFCPQSFYLAKINNFSLFVDP